MSTHIIHYFATSGRADVLKLIAEVGDVSYRFEGFQEENWPTIKVTHRYGQVPALTLADTDTVIYQTMVIARFLAQEGGLYPSNRLQATQSEEYVACIDEIISLFVPVYYAEDKEAALKKYEDGQFKVVMNALSGIVEKNGFLVGELCWADLVLVDFMWLAEEQGVNVSHFKILMDLRDRIAQMPKVKDYLESDRNLRKKTN